MDETSAECGFFTFIYIVKSYFFGNSGNAFGYEIHPVFVEEAVNTVKCPCRSAAGNDKVFSDFADLPFFLIKFVEIDFILTGKSGLTEIDGFIF